MLDAGIVAEIERLHYAEHWRIGTIAVQLGVQPGAVRRAVFGESGDTAVRHRLRFIPGDSWGGGEVRRALAGEREDS